MLHIGQKVVCIQEGWRPLLNSRMPAVTPRKGSVYTIHDMERWPIGGWLALALSEIDADTFFCAAHFRPVRTTSIEVFEHLLVTPPKAPAPRETVDG
jgi:hypothetical protein